MRVRVRDRVRRTEWPLSYLIRVTVRVKVKVKVRVRVRDRVRRTEWPLSYPTLNILTEVLTLLLLRRFTPSFNPKDVRAALNRTRSPLAAMTVLKKICDHPRLLAADRAAALGEKNFVRLNSERGRG